MGRITSKGLLSLMDCKKKYQLDHLSLKGTDKRSQHFKIALRKLIERYVQGDTWEDACRTVRCYLEENYKEEWFLLNWQKEKAVMRDLSLMERLWQWLPEKRGGVTIQGITQVAVECAFRLNDEEITSVSGSAEMVVHENGRVHAYIFGKNFSRPYSYRARKAENKVSGSIELLVLYEGLKRKYPDAESVDVSLVRLVSPSDKPDLLAGFEAKKGDNVVTLTEELVNKDCAEGICARIIRLVEGSEPIACKDCRYQGVCRRVFKFSGAPKDVGQESGTAKELKLSEAQQKVVAHKGGALRVCAGPGSGKTAVLVERVKRLIEDGVPPARILAVTFTKKAAQEMAERIGTDGPVVSTLHALAFGILTNQEYLVGTVRLAGKVDCKNLLVKILDHAPVIKGVSYEGLTMKYGLIATLLKDFEFIEKNGAEAFAAAFPKKDAEGILQVKQVYDEAFRSSGYITYDDQIAMAVRLLKEYPGILEDVRSAYDYIMVDEVQDLDDAQADFVCLLAGEGNPNLMICGDSDQSIYSFRGGSNKFMLEFLKRYPDAKDVWLEDNYRSAKEIVDAASALISQNRQRVPMNVRATFSTGFKAIHIPGFQERHMPELVREICAKGYSYGDVAIIARTNAQLGKLVEIAEREAAVSGNAVPLEQPKYYLRDDFSFQFLLNLLELKVKGLDQDAPMYRLLSWMGIEVEKTEPSLSIYEDYVKQKRIYAFDGAETDRYFLPDQGPVKQAFGEIYMGLLILNQPLKKAIDAIWETFPEKGLSREVQTLLQDMVYEKKIKNERQMYELMNAMVVFEDDTRIHYEDAGDAAQVHLLTGHDAKGKEFPVVILYEMDEFESGDTEEDRRLLYVAMTRAKRTLFLLESYPGKSAALKAISEHVTVNRRKRYEE